MRVRGQGSFLEFPPEDELGRGQGLEAAVPVQKAQQWALDLPLPAGLPAL